MPRRITSKEMYTDVNGNLIAQYYDPSIDDFVPFAEQSAVRILDKDGNPISSDNGLPVQLTGRNVVKNVGNDVEVITLANAQSIAPGGRIDIGLDYQGEKYRILSFSIDQQPWRVSTNSIYRSTPDYRGSQSGIYPYIDNETNTYNTIHPKEVLFTGYAGFNVLFKPESVEEVIEYVISYPNERIRVENFSEEVATLTVKLIRVGVGNYE